MTSEQLVRLGLTDVKDGPRLPGEGLGAVVDLRDPQALAHWSGHPEATRAVAVGEET
jgi:hypothetical protein